MTQDEVRELFDSAIAQAIDPDKVAKLELAREYFANPAFRAGLEQYVWELNNR